MESTRPPPLLEELRAIAQEAGRAVLSVYRGDFAVELKEDRSPLTEADRASHEIIRERLERIDPHLPLLSEESPEAHSADRSAWHRYWLVDPLDGTKEFVKRNGEFTVNIALIEDHVPVMGVVLAPALGLEYAGARDSGAWRASHESPLQRIRVCTNARTPVKVVGSRSHASPALAAYLEHFAPYELTSIGSSLKICLVADGRADLYPRLGPTCEWDTAAAQAILESAGGVMIDTAGRPLRYNSKDNLVNPHFLAFGDPKRDWLAAIEASSGS